MSPLANIGIESGNGVVLDGDITVTGVFGDEVSIFPSTEQAYQALCKGIFDLGSPVAPPISLETDSNGSVIFVDGEYTKKVDHVDINFGPYKVPARIYQNKLPDPE